MRELLHSTLKDIMDYDPLTGVFRWKNTPRTDLVGKRAGTLDSKGHRQVRVNRRCYLAHRLAWFYMTGEFPALDIDHIDGCRDNNAWSNLRLATDSQNQANSKTPKNNTSGAKGVYLHKPTGRWVAYVRVMGRSKYLGLYDSVEEASGAYAAGASKHFGEFARAA